MYMLHLHCLLFLIIFGSRKRDSETEEQRQQRKQDDGERQKQIRISKVNTMEGASQTFLQACKEGPDYVCHGCHRLMYRQTVVKIDSGKYLKVSDIVMSKICQFDNTYYRCQDITWICKTCDYTLKRGNLPAQAKVNSLTLDTIPVELSELNPLELCLISLRIPFMKMVALPRGRQRSIYGPAVNVPTDLYGVLTSTQSPFANTDGPNETQEEALLQSLLHVRIYTSREGFASPRVAS